MLLKVNLFNKHSCGYTYLQSQAESMETVLRLTWVTSKTMQEGEACAPQHIWVLPDIPDRRVFNAQLVPSSKRWLRWLLEAATRTCAESRLIIVLQQLKCSWLGVFIHTRVWFQRLCAAINTSDSATVSASWQMHLHEPTSDILIMWLCDYVTGDWGNDAPLSGC